MTEALQELAALIEAKQSDDVLRTEIAYDELSIYVNAAKIVEVIEFLRQDGACNFSTLIDITAVDYPGREKRFDMVYHLLSMYQNQRIRVKAAVHDGELVPSITRVFPVANWYEREVFDMYGLMFTGHPDLRRILTDYGFRGYPLRKDFPTSGYSQVRYDEERKRVVYEPLDLVQEYRQFDFMSPWEGAEYILPGDEKGEQKGKD
ncbi:NADH-quinone oxidoreductase subunit C [Paracoccaceae bacterium GXU_MW_L88]